MDILFYAFSIALFLLINPLVAFLLYILPLTLALLFRKINAVPITILSLLFGWFLPVWIACLLWAMFGESRRAEEEKIDDLPTGNKSTTTSSPRIFGVQWDFTNAPCKNCYSFFPKTEKVCPDCNHLREEEDKQG